MLLKDVPGLTPHHFKIMSLHPGEVLFPIQAWVFLKYKFIQLHILKDTDVST